MKRISAPDIGVDQGEVVMFSDYENDGPMWSGHGAREVRSKVRFSDRYMRPPLVHAAMSLVDFATEPYVRGDLRVENITRSGFELVFRTWEDSRVARIRATWLAIGELPDDERWDV